MKDIALLREQTVPLKEQERMRVLLLGNSAKVAIW